MRTRPTGLGCLLAALALCGCDGAQSALSPAGDDAIQLERLFWVMLAGAVVIWVLLNGLMFYVTRMNVAAMPRKLGEAIILGGGVVFPLIVLTALLGYGLSIMPDQRATGEGLRIRITGEQWWWRVEYWPDGAEVPVISANEIRLPVGQRTEIELAAERVIHAFWVPALGGKTDMIPGRINRMSLAPTLPGIYRGQCAEFCGLSHARMSFQAVAMSPDDFAGWLAREKSEAAPATTDAALAGKAVFAREGCAACHSVRGHFPPVTLGPDLTHVAERHSLASGSLPMTREALKRWIRDPQAIKPGAEMPGFDYLPSRDLDLLVTYLEGLT